MYSEYGGVVSDPLNTILSLNTKLSTKSL